MPLALDSSTRSCAVLKRGIQHDPGNGHRLPPFNASQEVVSPSLVVPSFYSKPQFF